ncbi:hypothetical protein [Lutibacter citreus]|nr:hypothetical protein [Lutibacter citreus]
MSNQKQSNEPDKLKKIKSKPGVIIKPKPGVIIKPKPGVVIKPK